LDYTHRREDGSVGAVPDSLKQPFKTLNGRTVYDGGGIDPDLAVEQPMTHPVTITLYEAGLLFDFSTTYAYEHPNAPDAKTFSLSNEDYNSFINWMKDKNYSYTSYLDEQFEEFGDEAKLERYYDELKPQLDLIQNKIAQYKKNELVIYKDQIKMALEEDIISRYYLEKGSVEVRFKYDADIKKAVEVLGNSTHYKKLLNIQ
jgi:carboxyl-terminal processing protease